MQKFLRYPSVRILINGETSMLIICHPNPTRTNFPRNAETGKEERIDLRIACTAPRVSSKERNPRPEIVSPTNMEDISRKGGGRGASFSRPFKDGWPAPITSMRLLLLMQSVSSDHRHNDETLRSPWSTKKASMSRGGRGWYTYTENMKRQNEERVDYPSARVVKRDRTIEEWGEGGGGASTTRMVVLCKGRSLINHGGPWVESVGRVSRSEGREWSKEKREGRGGGE